MFLLIPFVTKTFSQPPDPSQIPEPQIAYALHATWDPDLTDNNPSVCTTSGIVAVPWFHFYAGWKGGAPAFFSVDWVLIEELTNEHQPQVWYFKNPQGSSGFPYGCTMPPVSDPQNWNWTTWSFAPMIGFAMHNAPYRITVQWRYGVYMKGPRGPFQTSITINVQNLVVNSPDVGRVLRWDPEKGIADTSFSYNIECSQKKQVSVKVRIYDMNRNLVYELTEQKICPGSYSFTWDGTVNTGYYEYPPDEWSNIAPAGLYTFDVEVIANPYDRDAVRSQALTVVPGPVEYLGYDDGGTPDDESDDNHLYYLRWYALYSGRDASYGEIWLYDPELDIVWSWIVPVLQCVVHENCDGLTANPNGETHGVIIPVPVSLMEKAGTYRFVLHFYDDYADSYRNHQVKVALEVNVQRQQRRGLVIIIDETVATGEITKQDLQQVLVIVYDIFNNNLGIPTVWAIWDLTEPEAPLGAHQLKPDQKKIVRDYLQRVNAIPFLVVTFGRKDADYHVYAQIYPRSGDGTLNSPIGGRLQVEKVSLKVSDGEWTKQQAIWALANSIIHELTHIMASADHAPSTPRCVAESKFASHFLGPILNPFRNPQGKTVYLPWHDLRSEVNKILSFMGLPAW